MKLKIARVQALLNQKNPNADEAMKLLKPMVNKKSAPWQVYHYSGIAFMQKKEYQTALSFFHKSIEEGADEPQTYHSISYCYFQLGKYNDAEEYEETALEKKPDYFKGWLHLGAVYRAQAKLEKALKCYQKANQLNPKSAGVAFRIGDIYNDQGSMNKALELYDITIKIDSNYLVAYLAKAEILKKKRKFDDAEDIIYKVLSKEPRNLAARVSLAELNKYSGNYDKALELYERLVGEYPKNVGIRVNYALCMQELGRFEESEKNYLEAFKDQPNSFEPLSNYLMGLHYNPERTKEEIFEAHKLWDQHFAPKEKPVRPIPFNTDKNKKLRVGFISGGFRGHPVGWMITKALENLPENQFEIYCYTTNNKFDKVTKRIHNAIDKWQSVIGYNDEVIARMIRDDEIDILVELSGHSADTRLKTVALEPAPVIVKWVGGLFNTTGLESVDFLITDHQETPEGEEPFYTEKLVRMPDDYICFLPPDHAPEVGELPAKENGYITFGCFNNPTKVNDIVLEKWAEVMKQTPDSRLFLKSKQYDTEALRQRIIEKMAEAGIKEDRLIFEGHSKHDELLACYNRVDIALDPWPYSGGLTTCEALWMGVPVVTNPGPTFAGRHSTTHLVNAGYSEWVAENWDDYIKNVTGLAGNTKKLEEIRKSLRSKVKESPLCDGQRFGMHFSTALRKIWEQWVDGYENGNEEWRDHIEVQPLDEDQIERSAGKKEPSNEVQGMLDHIENEMNGTAVESENNGIDPALKNGQSAVNGAHTNGNNGSAGKENRVESNGEDPEVYKIETADDVTICTPPNTEMMTPYVLLEQKQWYENELEFIRDYLKRGMTVVDAGAGFGVYSLPAARLAGNTGKVFAFEPGSVAKHHLEMSKLENGLQNLEVIGKAVSAKNGKQAWKIADTPELNRLSESGREEVATVTLDAWWKFEGEPDVDLLKLDVNGSELDIVEGAKELLKKQSPVLLVSIAEQNDGSVAESLIAAGYNVYEYIPGPGILADYEPEAGTDLYLQNLVAVKEERIPEMKKQGWFHDESHEPEEPQTGLWKTELAKLPWTPSLMEPWEKQAEKQENKNYLRALDYLCAAEKLDVRKSKKKQARSEKAVLLLGAAQILIQLYNQGANSTSVAFTLVRTLNVLGKQGQAVEVMQKLIETTKLGQQKMNVDLPFMLPVLEQDKAPIKTDLSKWLMVRTVEAWILLKDLTTYLSGPQERKLLGVLEGNPEVMKRITRSVDLNIDKDEAEKKYVKNYLPNSFEEKGSTDGGLKVNSEDKQKLKHLYVGTPGIKGGAHGIHKLRAHRLVDEINKQGVGAEIISTSGPEFLEAIAKSKTKKGHAIYSGVMGYDLTIRSDMAVNGNIFDQLDLPVFGFLGDHPYTDFMWNRIINSADRTVFLTSIQSLKDEMQQIFPDVSVKKIGNLFPLSDQTDDLQPIETRPVDVLVPWGLHKFFANQKSLKQQLQEIGPKQKELGLAIYKEAVGNRRKSIYGIFLELYQSQYGDEYQFGETKSKDDFRWLKMLSTVDWMIRKDRRLKLLKDELAGLPENSHAVVTAHEKVAGLIPELKAKNNIKWIGEVSKEKLNQLYRKSKIVLNCNPTYLDNIHPRIYEGINNGCFIVSDYNHEVEKVFSDKDLIGIIGKNEEKKLADYLADDWKTLQEKNRQGHSIIQQLYTAEKHAESIIEIITKEMQ